MGNLLAHYLRASNIASMRPLVSRSLKAVALAGQTAVLATAMLPGSAEANPPRGCGWGIDDDAILKTYACVTTYAGPSGQTVICDNEWRYVDQCDESIGVCLSLASARRPVATQVPSTAGKKRSAVVGASFWVHCL